MFYYFQQMIVNKQNKESVVRDIVETYEYYLDSYYLSK